MTLYQQIVTGTEPTKPKPVQEDALLAQERINWIQSTGTRILFKHLTDEIKQLEAQARQLAVDYPQTQNHFKIVSLLQQSDTLHKLIEKYGRPKL